MPKPRHAALRLTRKNSKIRLSSDPRQIIARAEEKAAHYRRSAWAASQDRRPRFHRLPPQSSSASRFTAGAFGFLTLTQCGERPELYSESSRVGDWRQHRAKPGPHAGARGVPILDVLTDKLSRFQVRCIMQVQCTIFVCRWTNFSSISL
jgi:hypothetical protein